MDRRFADRAEAGRVLSERLRAYAGKADVCVLALPRGGVPVAYEVAHALAAPLDVFMVHKLGVPGHEELAMGAIAFGGVRVLNREVIDDLGVGQEAIDAVAAHEERELLRRETLYREGRPLLDVRGQRAILIDDGLATGSTMLAAARALRRLGPARIVVAVPVSAADTCAAFRHEVDEVVCAMTPESFVAVGLWYRDFSQTSDEEVRQLLARAAAQQPAPQLYRSAVPLPSH